MGTGDRLLCSWTSCSALKRAGGASPPENIRLQSSWWDAYGWDVLKCAGTSGGGVVRGWGYDPD